MACVGDKVAVICNPHDTWFSQRSWEEMWMEIPKVKVCTAAFCHDAVTEKAMAD